MGYEEVTTGFRMVNMVKIYANIHKNYFLGDLSHIVMSIQGIDSYHELLYCEVIELNQMIIYLHK